MFQLNRIVVLECPHLEIPWFHDRYCEENIVKGDSSKYHVSWKANGRQNTVFLKITCASAKGAIGPLHFLSVTPPPIQKVPCFKRIP